jgi:hypothetical protein
VLTQVPPNRWRSIIATAIPAPVSRPAREGPAWPAPMMIASKVLLMAPLSVDPNDVPRLVQIRMQCPARATLSPESEQSRGSAWGLLPSMGQVEVLAQEDVFIAVHNRASLPDRRHRSQQPFSKGALGGACREFGAVPPCCDPLRAAAQTGSGRIHRLSHWTTPP